MSETLTPDQQIDVLKREFVVKHFEFKNFPSQRLRVVAEIDALLDAYNIIQFRQDWEPEAPYGV